MQQFSTHRQVSTGRNNTALDLVICTIPFYQCTQKEKTLGQHPSVPLNYIIWNHAFISSRRWECAFTDESSWQGLCVWLISAQWRTAPAETQHNYDRKAAMISLPTEEICIVPYTCTQRERVERGGNFNTCTKPCNTECHRPGPMISKVYLGTRHRMRPTISMVYDSW